MQQNLFAFELGREWKLSLAEIEAVFGVDSVRYANERLAIIETDRDIGSMFANLGGVIRCFRIHAKLSDIREFPHRVQEMLSKTPNEGKLSFALGVIGEVFPIFQSGLRIKKTLKGQGRSVRFANKDDKNLVSIAVQKEGFTYSGNEFFTLRCGKELFFASTIAVQNIDAFASRDLEKVRDMQVGMLPTKLALTMINLAVGPIDRSKVILYDPFCGLGTIGIEAIHLSIPHIFASDIEKNMIDASRENFKQFSLKKTESAWEVFSLDARRIGQFPRIQEVTHMVTEGYLGSIMNEGSVSLEKIEKEQLLLASLYDSMFRSLKEVRFDGTICITVPVWFIKNAPYHFVKFKEILSHHQFWVLPIRRFPLENLPIDETLIYRRPGQTVGREVFLIARRG